VSLIDKFDRLAPGFSDREYADPKRYAARRARVAVDLGPPLAAGGTVLDLACGDGIMAEPLLAAGLRYCGVDGSAAMIAEARSRLGEEVPLEVGTLETYEPSEPVEMTLCLRTVYAFPDPRELFARVAGYTRTKFVFDFDPRAQDRDELVRGLRASGFASVELRPFLLPQRVAVPAPLRVALYGLEHAGPLARAALQVRGVWFCAASPMSD
jgi:SAM-dependent methyltransferase